VGATFRTVPEPIWTPSPQRVAAARITEFAERFGLAGFDELHRFSVELPGAFWRGVWDDAGVIGDPGAIAYHPGGGGMRGARFFPEARLNFAENLLREPSNDLAIIGSGEHGEFRKITRSQLHELVNRVAAAMRERGVGRGDRVAAWLPNGPASAVVMLAATAIGAVFSATSPDFGVDAVVERFGQIEPVLLFATTSYIYGGKRHDCLERLRELRTRLPTVRETVLVEGLEEWAPPAPRIEFERFGFDHPLVILYSSGTTGPPKCIVHRAGGLLLKHLAEHQLQCDIRRGDRVFYYTTCGWMMWNWLVSALASDAAIVMHDGAPFHPSELALFDVADRLDITLMGVSAKYLDRLNKLGVRPRDTHVMPALRTICSTGSPLAPASFEYVYRDVHPYVHLASISGGTDLCGCLVMGDPARPVYAGEIQGPALGVAAEVFDEQGRPAPPGFTGELVCTRAFPSMPLRFHGDPDGSRYTAAYFERFPGRQVWAQGDFASRTDHGGFVIHGRSDATLNPGGIRIGTAEIYRTVESMPEILEALAVGQPFDGDTRIVLFVVLAPGTELDERLVSSVKERLRLQCSPRHVPARVVAVTALPRTHNGKLAELAVADVIAGRAVRNRDALANPEALDGFADRPELHT
jgi:acetoacetyl-CoA synthetase